MAIATERDGDTRVAVFHPGTQHSWQTARALQELGRLEWYATSILYQPDRWPYWLERLPAPVGPRLHDEFNRFAATGLDPARVRTSGTAEWLERIARRAGRHHLARWLDRVGNDRFGRALASAIDSPAPFAVWGYDSSALEGFRAARQRGRFCILDRTIGHRRALQHVMAKLRRDWPDWFDGTTRLPSPDEIARDDDEIAAANLVAVGSEAAAATIRACSTAPDLDAKLRVLPYCFDQELFGRQPAPEPVSGDNPVRFLLVGQLEPRKGIHLLLNAIARIPREHASLTLVGGLSVPASTFAPYADRVTHIPHVPRSAVPALMARHDVLVFPSYFEGSALSLLEALASGLAIIQSREAGNGVTPACGLVLAEHSVDALIEAMRVPIYDRDRLNAWRRAAQVEARKYDFGHYRDNIGELLSSIGL